MATRVASGEVINALAGALPALIGGSADLGVSNNTDIKEGGSFQPASYGGRILHFGVREHAMGATLTGISLNGGLIPYGGTFLTFSDYMKPAIRLAALSEVQVVYVFTHDSIGLGEDGPTHQPVEHIAGLRAIPNLYVIRPADPHETREAWRIAIARRHAPTALILTRQKVPVLDQKLYNPAEGARRGAYILAEATDAEGRIVATPQLIIIATGSEVSLALQAREELQKGGTSVRVVSMPCCELFDEQEASYREEVLPRVITARLAVEAGASLGWARYTGLAGDCVCLDRFGASAPGDVALRNLGFNVENVTSRARALLR
jgi:transketolase